jgi:hypothetical protein
MCVHAWVSFVHEVVPSAALAVLANRKRQLDLLAENVAEAAASNSWM